MKIDSRLLRSHPLLSHIPGLILRRLLAQAKLDEYPKGSIVCRAGKPCEAVYLILSGRCQSQWESGAIEGIYGSGETLGIRELLNNEPWRATVSVLTHCVLLAIPAKELEEVFTTRPSIAGRVSATLSGRVSPSIFPWAAPRETPKVPTHHTGRILSLLALSKSTDPLARRLAREVCHLTHERTLLVQFHPDEGGFPLCKWAERFERGPRFDGGFFLEDHLKRHESRPDWLSVSTRGDEREPAAIASFLSHLAQHYDYVLLHLTPRLAAPIAVECLIQSDLTYLFLGSSSSDLYQYHLLTRQLSDTQQNQIRPLLYLDPSLPREEVFSLMSRLAQPVHSILHELPPAKGEKHSPALERHLRRLAREIGRRRVGIAFSSGGARGLAHIGVIQVLEENGIEIDLIAGSSMGAYVGSIWAHGYNGEMLERIAREVEGRWGILHLIDPVLPPRRGFITTQRVARRLRRSLGHSHFFDMAIPLRVVATRLTTMERVIFSTGEVATAVEASVAIPGICIPVEIDGETYIDGGIAEPLPVEILREAGVEKVIAVNTLPTPEQLSRFQVASTEPAWWERFIGHFNYFASGNILDTISRTTHGMQMRVAEMSWNQADLVLHAISADSRWHDVNHPGKYIAIGRSVAEAHLPQIINLVKGERHEKRLA